MVKLLTLCIIQREDEVLLGMKKRGFGMGKWNGFGGHVEEGETVEEAMRREVLEEAGLVIKSFEKKGMLEFVFEGDPAVLEVHVYHSADFEGEPQESDEMIPQWFQRTSLPFEEMWADDRHWLPLLFEGKVFQGKFLFRDHETLVDYRLEIQ